MESLSISEFISDSFKCLEDEAEKPNLAWISLLVGMDSLMSCTVDIANKLL